MFLIAVQKLSLAINTDVALFTFVFVNGDRPWANG